MLFFCWIIVGYSSFYWIVAGYSSFYCIVAGYSSFYWIVAGYSSFTELLLVVPHFAESMLSICHFALFIGYSSCFNAEYWWWLWQGKLFLFQSFNFLITNCGVWTNLPALGTSGKHWYQVTLSTDKGECSLIEPTTMMLSINIKFVEVHWDYNN